MKKALDLNDCYSKDEVFIYKSTANLFSKIFLNFLLIVFTIISFYSQKDNALGMLITLVLGIVSLFMIYKTKAYYNELDEIQLCISIKGVQYLDDVLVPWNFIENERIEEIEDGESTIYYFVYYCKNIDRVVQLDLEEFSVSGKVLVSVFKIFRNRSVS